ncbi:hypothetical protein ACP4OV_009923 [Aristida adscensionis]
MAALVLPPASSGLRSAHHHRPHHAAGGAFLPRCGAAAAPPPPPVVLVRWTPPPPGWWKLNFDGSVFHDGTGRASVGGAVRDCAGRVVLAFAERTEHAAVGVVEARTLRRGLHLALRDGCRRASSSRATTSRSWGAIVELLGCLDACEVRHVYREGNQVAHTLCREVYRREQVWDADRVVPFAVWEKVEDDRRGVPHERVLRAT